MCSGYFWAEPSERQGHNEAALIQDGPLGIQNTMTQIPSLLEEQVLAALTAEQLPVRWLLGDDKCDCAYQRIGEWGNPYLAQTIQFRFCCIWAELSKQFPQFVQEVPAFWDDNRLEPLTEPQAWDSEEMDMPLYLWYRQLSRQTGRPLADIRAEYQHRQDERPRKVPKGTGRESRQPNVHEVRLALLDRLGKTGWNAEDRARLFVQQDQEERAARQQEKARR